MRTHQHQHDIHATPQSVIAGITGYTRSSGWVINSFTRQKILKVFGYLPPAEYVCFAVAQHVYLPAHVSTFLIVYVNHPLACFGNGSIPLAQITFQLRPRGIYPIYLEGGAFTMFPESFSRVCLDKGRLFWIVLVFAEKRVRGRLLALLWYATETVKNAVNYAPLLF